MAKRDQHFVPRVYLKRWSPRGNENVYYYPKSDLSIGEPRNVASILFERHTYTITFDYYYVLEYMPLVKKDFGEQIKSILVGYNALAYYNDCVLNSPEALTERDAITNIDQWVFKKADCPERLASRRGILSNIKEVRSYLLETALDDYVEKKWNSVLDSFLTQIDCGCSIRTGNEDIMVDEALIEEMISILLLFMCRNPQFDFQGIFPRVENTLLSVLLATAENQEQENEIHALITQHMRAAWLSQIYKALFSEDASFFHEFSTKIKERCQATIMRCSTEVGSFITTDNPAFAFVCNAMKSNYNAIYFPLSPQYLLLIGKGQSNCLNKIDVRTITNKGVKHFNSIILSNANTDIVSNYKYLGYLI